jgi:hypothetical protein
MRRARAAADLIGPTGATRKVQGCGSAGIQRCGSAGTKECRNAAKPSWRNAFAQERRTIGRSERGDEFPRSPPHRSRGPGRGERRPPRTGRPRAGAQREERPGSSSQRADDAPDPTEPWGGFSDPSLLDETSTADQIVVSPAESVKLCHPLRDRRCAEMRISKSTGESAEFATQRGIELAPLICIDSTVRSRSHLTTDLAWLLGAALLSLAVSTCYLESISCDTSTARSFRCGGSSSTRERSLSARRS